MPSIRVIKVPDVGEGVAEVELVAWHVQVGDRVAEDQALADVMTDKASVEIPSPVAGRVQALGGEVGQTMAVGSELIRIEVDDAGGAAVPSGSAAVVPAVAAAPTFPALAPSPGTVVALPVAPASAHAPAPSPARAIPPPPPAPVAGRRPIASPAVRRRAWEHGIDLQQVPATGTAGRIMQADLDAVIAARGAQSPAVVPASRTAALGAERHDAQAIPVIGLRRRIAVQMQEAKRRIPHFSYVEEIDVTEVEALRAALNEKWGAERGRLTLLPLLMRAMVLAVSEFPQINATFDDEAGIVTRHGAVHLGVATQTTHGLMVPVVRHAEAMDLWALA
ncbi:MAG: 2-oxo acid dehydrogenase subunit E2, partial [Rubrivivax sp.]|nr:2-oxo acid dehydrogenase subunit E2 [Rubrivivax sp.]MBP6462421.1 2-oxo acid dehydrogenase subunit E2 [Rubrivivax sp.]